MSWNRESPMDQKVICLIACSTYWLAQIMQVSPDGLTQRPFRKLYPQPLPFRCAAHRANRIAFRLWKGCKPEQWPSHAVR